MTDSNSLRRPVRDITLYQAKGAAESPVCSIVVLAWPPNQARTNNVFSFLKSVPKHVLGSAVEVVVVVNGHDPDLSSRLKVATNVDVLLDPCENLGVATGWNLGARYARGEILVIANEDALLGPNTLARLIVGASNPTNGFVGVKGEWWTTRTMRSTRCKSRRKGSAGQDRLILIPFGFLFAVRKTLWDEIGGVDDALSPAFFEEADLAFRAALRGLKTAVVDDPEVRHESGVSVWNANRIIEWSGGTVSVTRLHRRNHRHMIEVWSSWKWLGHPVVHCLAYAAYRAVMRSKDRLLSHRGLARLGTLAQSSATDNLPQ